MRSAGNRSGVNCNRWKPCLNAGGHRLDRQRLGQAGHAFEQNVTVGEQSEQKPVDQIFLSDDDVTDLLA